MKQEEKMLPVGAALIRARQYLLGLLEEHAAADEAGKSPFGRKKTLPLWLAICTAPTSPISWNPCRRTNVRLFWRGLPTEKRALVVIEVSEPVRADIIEQTPDEETAALLARMPGEDVAIAFCAVCPMH